MVCWHRRATPLGVDHGTSVMEYALRVVQIELEIIMHLKTATSSEPAAPHPQLGIANIFAHLANRTALLAGNYKTFVFMVAVVLVWAISGPLFSFSTTWQLVINTGTTIVTFLMVFLIQNTQNRDSLAVHLKLDEIIRSIDVADDELMRAEDETD